MVAHRDAQTGAWVVDSLVDVFAEHGDKEHAHELFVKASFIRYNIPLVCTFKKLSKISIVDGGTHA